MSASVGSEDRALVVRPIGYARTPLREKHDAPRQGTLSTAVGTIELVAGMDLEHAVEDLVGWQFIWLLYWFDRVEGWRPKVRPPRSSERRGVLSTRSPHRPNPIGMTVAELLGVEGRTLHVARIDLLDGTPVIDVKPYVPYSDSIPTARCGWLDDEAARSDARTRIPSPSPPADPHLAYDVDVSDFARRQLEFIHDETGFDLAARARATLSESPDPRAYRRIRRRETDCVLAVKGWRIVFTVDARIVRIERVESGFRPGEIADEKPGSEGHGAFAARFGGRSSDAL